MSLVRTTLVVVAALAPAACAGDANVVRDIARASGITGGEPKPAPDFVSRTRTDAPDFQPVGVSAPRRERAKDKDKVAAAETELNGLRSRNEMRGVQARRAGQTPAAVVPKQPPPAPE